MINYLVNDTVLDPLRYVTVATSTTAQTVTPNQPYGRLMIVAVGADCLVEIGDDPTAGTTSMVVPAGQPLLFGTHNEVADVVSIRTVSGSGIATIYSVN